MVVIVVAFSSSPAMCLSFVWARFALTAEMYSVPGTALGEIASERRLLWFLVDLLGLEPAPPKPTPPPFSLLLKDDLLRSF